jgi:hypothetical protein
VGFKVCSFGMFRRRQARRWSPDANDLRVVDVTIVVAERTFWDKAVILHGLRQWFEKRNVLRSGGQRILAIFGRSKAGGAVAPAGEAGAASPLKPID